MMKKPKGYYYDIEDDLKEYPDAWAYIIIGGRNTGKTYSALKYHYLNKNKFVFLKRTIEDVNLLCTGSGKVGSKSDDYGVDLSPFKSINRDLLCDVRANSIRNGIGGFWEYLNGEPQGTPIAYCLALNAVSKIKGFDLSECSALIFDEFVPQPWDRINRKEGEQLLDLYKTVARDREHRGQEPLKLICLANATSISNPVMNILEITDTVAQMQAEGTDKLMIPERGIFIHMIKDNPEFYEKEHESLIYKAMGNTSWGKMAFENEFAYNDFSSIGRTSLKGYKPWCAVSYKEKNWYIYNKMEKFYMCTSRHNSDNVYNLNQENDQKRFWLEEGADLRNSCIDGNMLFETYTMYDLIVNYKRIFAL